MPFERNPLLFCFKHNEILHLSLCHVTILFTPCNFPALDRKNACILLEQLREAAGGGVADHLGDLTHGEVGVYEQVFRLTHPPPLNILRDAASELPLEAALQLCLAHARDAGKPFKRDVKGIVVGDVAYNLEKQFGIYFHYIA